MKKFNSFQRKYREPLTGIVDALYEANLVLKWERRAMILIVTNIPYIEIANQTDKRISDIQPLRPRVEAYCQLIQLNVVHLQGK